MSWRAATPLLLDGIAWGVPPADLIPIVAHAAPSPALEAVGSDLAAGRPFAAALAARGAPVEVVQAARAGERLNAQAGAGVPSRAAHLGARSDRLILLSGLALPLLTLLMLATSFGLDWTLAVGAPAGQPTWVIWTARIAALLGALLALGLVAPALGRALTRLPGLRWIGRRRRAARLADLLAVGMQAGGLQAGTTQAGGPLAETLDELALPALARAVRAGTPLPEALRRHPDGRPLAQALADLGPASWPTALRDRAARLRVEATDQVTAQATALRVGGTALAAILVAVWLLWIYGSLGGLPERMVAP